MKDKIDYLNNFIKSKDKTYYKGPSTLFKYRAFDEYAFEMIEKNYIYLCPAENLDDETECVTTLDIEKMYDLENDGLKRHCADLIIQIMKPYTSKENYELARRKIYNIMGSMESIRPNFMFEIAHELQEMVPEFDIGPYVNFIVDIPEKLNNSSVKHQFEKLVTIALNARKNIGVCSLCESNQVEDMWEKYADKERGYCIEFDMSSYQTNYQILPVIYQDKRETNIIIQFVADFLGEFIFQVSSGKMNADRSKYLSLFLSKYKEWEYQREWRVLGDAKAKPVAPRIKGIYLGRNVSTDNEKRIIELAMKKKFNVYKINGSNHFEFVK